MTLPVRRTEWKRWRRAAATSLVVVATGIQFIRPDRPPGELPGDGHMNDLVAVPAPVDSLLRRACYDCHSDETRWPLYAQVAPVSWLLVYDVRHGRSNLDFSRWSLDPTREPTPQQRFEWMCRDVRRGTMPPRLYLLIHRDARLTQDDTNALCAWAQQRAMFSLEPNSDGDTPRLERTIAKSRVQARRPNER